MLNISINDLGAEELFSTMHHKLDEIDELLSEIGQHIVDAVHGNIDAEGRPEPWPPPAKFQDHPLLRDTGYLYNSINFVVSGDEVEVDCDADYGHYHNEGTSRLPQREFLNLTFEDEAEITKIVAAHFDF